MTQTIHSTRSPRQPRLRTLAGLAIGLGAALAAVTVFDHAMLNAQEPQPKAPEVTITLATKPTPPVTGDNEFEVTVTGPDSKPVVGADVSVLLVMPAMPKMNMPEMRSSVSMKPAIGKAADEGKYVGKGEVMMAGRWNVTISVRVGTTSLGEKKLTLMAR